jgi:tRNA(Phe) wybutosine-synthesizing methylase Tyw3
MDIYTMPNYKVVKVPNKNCWKVMRGAVIHMKCGTLSNAKKQVALLNELDFRSKAHKKMK